MGDDNNGGTIRTSSTKNLRPSSGTTVTPSAASALAAPRTNVPLRRQEDDDGTAAATAKQKKKKNGNATRTRTISSPTGTTTTAAAGGGAATEYSSTTEHQRHHHSPPRNNRHHDGAVVSSSPTTRSPNRSPKKNPSNKRAGNNNNDGKVLSSSSATATAAVVVVDALSASGENRSRKPGAVHASSSFTRDGNNGVPDTYARRVEAKACSKEQQQRRAAAGGSSGGGAPTNDRPQQPKKKQRSPTDNSPIRRPASATTTSKSPPPRQRRHAASTSSSPGTATSIRSSSSSSRRIDAKLQASSCAAARAAAQSSPNRSHSCRSHNTRSGVLRGHEEGTIIASGYNSDGGANDNAKLPASSAGNREDPGQPSPLMIPVLSSSPTNKNRKPAPLSAVAAASASAPPPRAAMASKTSSSLPSSSSPKRIQVMTPIRYVPSKHNNNGGGTASFRTAAMKTKADAAPPILRAATTTSAAAARPPPNELLTKGDITKSSLSLPPGGDNDSGSGSGRTSTGRMIAHHDGDYEGDADLEQQQRDDQREQQPPSSPLPRPPPLRPGAVSVPGIGSDDSDDGDNSVVDTLLLSAQTSMDPSTVSSLTRTTTTTSTTNTSAMEASNGDLPLLTATLVEEDPERQQQQQQQQQAQRPVPELVHAEVMRRSMVEAANQDSRQGHSENKKNGGGAGGFSKRQWILSVGLILACFGLVVVALGVGLGLALGQNSGSKDNDNDERHEVVQAVTQTPSGVLHNLPQEAPTNQFSQQGGEAQEEAHQQQQQEEEQQQQDQQQQQQEQQFTTSTSAWEVPGGPYESVGNFIALVGVETLSCDSSAVEVIFTCHEGPGTAAVTRASPWLTARYNQFSCHRPNDDPSSVTCNWNQTDHTNPDAATLPLGVLFTCHGNDKDDYLEARVDVRSTVEGCSTIVDATQQAATVASGSAIQYATLARFCYMDYDERQAPSDWYLSSNRETECLLGQEYYNNAMQSSAGSSFSQNGMPPFCYRRDECSSADQPTCSIPQQVDSSSPVVLTAAIQRHEDPPNGWGKERCGMRLDGGGKGGDSPALAEETMWALVNAGFAVEEQQEAIWRGMLLS